MNYITANNIQVQTDELFTNGLDGGVYVGFKNLSEFYNVKKGCTTYIGGIPSHGKTEFHLEILMSLTEHYGWKHAIFSPETGSPAEIVAELAHKHIGKSYTKGVYQMSQQEKYNADAFLSDSFFIMTPEENKLTVDNLLEISLEIKKKHGLDSFSIDPFNELIHDYSNSGGREDKYLENTLGKIRRFAREHNIHIFIIAHPRTLKPVDGIYQPPTAFELSGGAAWYAKAETIICVHRPTIDTNEVEIHIQKAKPKQIGKKGKVSLFWDWKKSRYYERLDSGTCIYSTGKEKAPQIEQNRANLAIKNYYESETETPF